MRRPFALPPGIKPAQARDAALAICARARGLDEARELLRCAGLIPDPHARGGYRLDPAGPQSISSGGQWPWHGSFAAGKP